MRSCSLSLSSSLSLSLSFLRPSENLKPHQRWQRSQIGVLDNQTGERSRTALVSESSTATGWNLILPPISYFTISNENQLFSINLIIIQDGTTAAAPRILGRVFARDSQASPSSGCLSFVFFLTFFECLFIFAHRPAHHQVVDCLSFVTLFEGQPIIRSLRCINFVTSLVFETL